MIFLKNNKNKKKMFCCYSVFIILNNIVIKSAISGHIIRTSFWKFHAHMLFGKCLLRTIKGLCTCKGFDVVSGNLITISRFF